MATARDADLYPIARLLPLPVAEARGPTPHVLESRVVDEWDEPLPHLPYTEERVARLVLEMAQMKDELTLMKERLAGREHDARCDRLRSGAPDTSTA